MLHIFSVLQINSIFSFTFFKSRCGVRKSWRVFNSIRVTIKFKTNKVK